MPRITAGGIELFDKSVHQWCRRILGGEFAILPDAYHGAAREELVAWSANDHPFVARHAP